MIARTARKIAGELCFTAHLLLLTDWFICGRNRWPYNRQLPTLHSSRGDYLVCTTPRLLSRSAHGRGSHI